MRNIQVGDLVQVIAPAECCGQDKFVGFIFKVGIICKHPLICLFCNHYGSELMASEGEDAEAPGFPPHRLKRIPPLNELEGIKTQEPLKEGVH